MRSSKQISKPAATVGGHRELGAAALLKAVWWGMRLARMMTHLSFFVCCTHFLLLSIPSLFTRLVPLRFKAEGRRRRPDLGLVYCVYFMLSVLLN